jgi:sarcosine oxidase subunit gamma
MSEQAVDLLDSLPTSGFEAASPLGHVNVLGLPTQAADAAGIVFGSLATLGLLSVRLAGANGEQRDVFEELLGMSLPTGPLTSSTHDDRVVRWISPDEWLLSVSREELFALEVLFAERMPGHYSLVNVTGGLAVWQLSGRQVLGLLRKCVPVDLHITVFPFGKVVSTLCAKSSVILRRQGEDAFELVVRRSFADYLWRWIDDASREFGGLRPPQRSRFMNSRRFLGP